MKKIKLLTGISTVCFSAIFPLTATISCGNKNNEQQMVKVSLIRGYEKLYKIDKTEAPINEDLVVTIEPKDGVTPINGEDLYVVVKNAELPPDWYNVELLDDGLKAKITLDKEDVFADIKIGVFEGDLYDYKAKGKYVSKYTDLPQGVYSDNTAYLKAYVEAIEQDPHIFEDDCYCCFNDEFLETQGATINELKAGFKVLDIVKGKISYDASAIIDVKQGSVELKASFDLHFENVKLDCARWQSTWPLNMLWIITLPCGYSFPNNMVQNSYYAMLLKVFDDWKMTCDVKVDKLLPFSTNSYEFTDLSLDSTNFVTSPIYTTKVPFSFITSTGSASIAYYFLPYSCPLTSNYFKNVKVQ